jgi:hypothetical protein
MRILREYSGSNSQDISHTGVVPFVQRRIEARAFNRLIEMCMTLSIFHKTQNAKSLVHKPTSEIIIWKGM